MDQRTLRLNGGKSGADQEFQAQGFGIEFSRSVGTTRKYTLIVKSLVGWVDGWMGVAKNIQYSKSITNLTRSDAKDG